MDETVNATNPKTIRQEVPPAVTPAPVTVAAPVAATVAQPQTTRSADDERVASIRARIGDNAERFPDVYAKAMSEGWGVERAVEEIRVASVRARTPAIPPGGGSGPAVHVHNREAECTPEVLGAALMLRQGIPLDHPVFQSPAMLGGGRPGTLRHAAPWLARQINDTVRQQVMDRAHQFAHLSLPDICREAVRLDAQAGRQCRDLMGQPIHSRDVDLRFGSHEETIRAAVSGGSLSAMFTTNVNAELLIAYQQAPDTTVGWVQEDDFDNFQKKEFNWMGRMGGLTKHARGKSDAQSADIGDHSEEAKIDRYVGSFVIDEMDLSDNRFGNLQQDSPQQLGLSARRLRPDLVYSKLLANPNLSDGVAVFDSTRGNDGGSATFSGPNVYAGYVAMRKQRERGAILDITPRFLVATIDLQRDAELALMNRIILASSPVDGGTVTGGQDPVVKLNLQIVTDPRLSGDGVVDPDTGTKYTGGADTWFLFAKAGEQGAKTMIVGYRRGTGRAPVMRGYMLDRGQWGIGWDINLDIGVAFLDGRAAYRGKVNSQG